MSFNFWQKWLVGVGIYHVLFGLLLAFFGQSHFMDVMMNQYYDPLFWPGQNISVGTLTYKNWMTSVLGAVVASWGSFIAFIAYYPFKSREKWAWYCITTSVLLWFAIDTGYSLYYGVTINALFNLMTLTLFLVPLLFTRKYF
ncbi:MAG: hypothetical protein ACU85E_09160 [Gammaproteobacteria bacterium]